MPQNKKNYRPLTNGLKNTTNALSNHYCHKDERWIEKDLRGSPMVTVCPDCREEKLKNFTRDSMTQPLYGTEPRKLARKDGMETSKEAAGKVNSSRLESEVYQVILGAGPRGMISDEVRNAMPHVNSYSSVTARYKSLKEKHLIVATEERRPGASGRNQSVLVASTYIPEEETINYAEK